MGSPAPATSKRAVDSAWQAAYPMARLSSWRAGGAAAWLFTPQGIAAEAGEGDNPMLTLPYALPPQVRAHAHMHSEPPLFVGYGSNLLVRDGGYDGIVVHTAPGLQQLREEDGKVRAGVGVGCPKVAKFCAARGRDAAFFAGIPGTVGGALAMNAGCHGGETWQYVSRVWVLAGGRLRAQSPEAFAVAYRSVQCKDGGRAYFTEAEFNFPAAPAAAVRGKVKDLLRQRADTQPLGNASAGSVFCNPPDDFAGRLIEQCGLKNARVGGAVVSGKHANFIVNDNAATAADIEQLILQVQTQVAEKTGTMLRTEVQIVGRAA